MSVSEYEKRFSELVRLVPYIQADEVLKCKKFLAGLQHRIRVHLWRPSSPARPNLVGGSEPKPRGRPVEAINQIRLSNTFHSQIFAEAISI